MNLRLVSGKIEKGTVEAAGFDLFYAGAEPLLIGDSVVKVPTGVRTVIAEGYCAVVREKSGLASQGIESKGGLIDSDYRGEWIVMLRKPIDRQWVETPCHDFMLTEPEGWTPFVLEPGMKVAPVATPHRRHCGRAPCRRG